MENLPPESQDLCLTCGRLTVQSFGGDGCEPGHITVGRYRCQGCQKLLGIRVDSEYHGITQAVCPDCLETARWPAMPEPERAQVPGVTYTLVRTAQAPHRYLHQIHGVVYLSWLEERDAHYAQRFVQEKAQGLLETFEQMAGQKLELAIVGADVLT